MTRRNVLFHISGHGYGHAARSAEVIRALRRHAHVGEVHVRTRAPAWLIQETAGHDVPVHPVALDAGVMEQDPLTIDVGGTLRRARELVGQRRALVEQEVRALRALNVALVVADIPWLAGEVAEAAGVPCVALGNFTWDWIYAGYQATHPEFVEVMEAARAGYARMSCWLRLPFHHAAHAFPRVHDVPLIVRQRSRSAADTLQALGIPSHDARPRILLGLRGGVDDDTVRRALQSAPDLLFISATPTTLAAPNLAVPASSSGLTFTDLLGVSRVALSKLGYGTVAEAMASGVAVLWPRRTGFPEDAIFDAELSRHLAHAEIPRADFRAGHWAPHLRRLVELPAPPRTLALDGAEHCARFLGGLLR
ncbi:MAG: hypothetical protein AB2A00_12460 [Myxococcota bacterium]